MDVLLLLVDDLGVTGVDYALDKVSGVIDFGYFVSILNCIVAFLNLVLSLHLNHLSSLAYQIETCGHKFRLLLLILLESLQVDEADVLYGALDWHVDHSGHLG